MMKNNIFLIFLQLSFSLLLFSCNDQDEKVTLAGQWEPATRPYNLGNVLIFGEDSSFTQIKEARVNYTYELIEDTLISTSFSGLTGEKIIDSAKVTLFNDTLILVRGNIGDQLETVMVWHDSVYTLSDEITGFWKWSHQSGRDAISEYHPGGKAAVSVALEKREGNYSINGDSLTIVMPGTTLRNIHFELKGDSLFFPHKYAPFGKTFYRVKDEDKSEE
jgi:hypothetical protein